jgi:hypothetical protein
MNCVKSQKHGVRRGVCRAFYHCRNVESCGVGEVYHGIYLDHQEIYFSNGSLHNYMIELVFVRLDIITVLIIICE